MTLPNDPVPSVFRRSKSSSFAVFCKDATTNDIDFNAWKHHVSSNVAAGVSLSSCLSASVFNGLVQMCDAVTIT